MWLWGSGTPVFAVQAHAPDEPSVILTTKIIGQDLCAVNSHLDTLRMRVQLRYENVGARRIILYRGHDLFYQMKIRRRTSADGTKPYEVMTVNSRYFDEQPERIEQPTPGKVFVSLAPGASYEREILIGVGVVGEDALRGRDTIVSGEHTLQFVVSTWYQSRSLALKLRQQWEPKGLLWIDPLISSPLNFTVERQSSNVPCR